MGGAPCCEGNVTPAAEYNIWVDPEAARAVFRSTLPIEMIGWHVSRGESVLSDAEVAAIEALGTAKARFAIESNSRAREAYHIQTGEIGLSLADPTAMAIALDRSVGLSWSRHRVAIECSSELTRGMTVVDRLGVNSDAINGPVWGPAAGESAGADIVWTFDSAKFKSMLKAALATFVAALAERVEAGPSEPCAVDSGPPAAWEPATAAADRALRRNEHGRPAATCLGEATSPYLLQHADNPVHWRAWGAEALAEAKRRDCPILLSIGYAACHWCHVMAHELFENAETAEPDERALRQREGRSRRAARHRPHLHDGAACDGPAGRLAADHVPRSRGRADVRRHLLAARAALGPSVVPAGARSWSPTAWRTRRPTMEENGAALAEASRRSSSAPSPGRALTPDDLTRVGDGLLAAVDPGPRRASAARRNSPTRRSSASSGTRCSAAAIRHSARRCGRCSRR